MAETLTYDPGTDTVTDGEGNSLTPSEQESLEIGQELVDQQEGLLAGKYKDAASLEKAYIELQKKLGEDGKEENTPEAEQEEVLPEESEEKSEELSPAAELISSASEEFSKSGELTAETLDKFSSMSSKELVEAYMQVESSLPELDNTPDITDAVVNQVRNFAGGEEAYNNMVQWASSNLKSTAIDAFDQIIGSGSVEAINLAVAGLKAQYDNANGYEGTMVSGKAPQTTKDIFRSQAELVAAMSDKRYDNDAAYRQDVIEKLERSDNLQF